MASDGETKAVKPQKDGAGLMASTMKGARVLFLVRPAASHCLLLACTSCRAYAIPLSLTPMHAHVRLLEVPVVLTPGQHVGHGGAVRVSCRAIR